MSRIFVYYVSNRIALFSCFPFHPTENGTIIIAMAVQAGWPKSIIAYILTFIMVSAAVLPSPWLWQCSHVSRIVSGPFITSSMPCNMDMSAMAQGKMPCCRVAKISAKQSPSNQPTLSEPNCHPTLTEMVQRAVQRTETQPRLKVASVLATDVSPLPPASPLAITLRLLRHPDDNSDPPGYLRVRSIAPRGPPVA